MTISLSLPMTHELKPKISVVGVGGAGGNAVNNMITSHLEGVEFVACNTDAQSLANCLTDRRIQLGNQITHGLGAGARPEVGRAAAEESLDELLENLGGSHMVFITAGMGGGTGTGAAPVIARAVREQGILTVGVVTKPFHFEGAHRMRLAEAGLTEMQQYVDTLIVIPNQNLFRLATERTTFADAFRMADQVLHMGVRGVTDLMVMPGVVNLDFADIRTVMSEMGKAMMGTGEADGERRAIDAAEAAISNPLLDDVSMRGARAVLINITGGVDMTLFEIDAAANRIREEVDGDANIIFGSTFDNSIEGRMRVSVVATGIDARVEAAAAQPAHEARAPEAAGMQLAARNPFAGGLRFPTQAQRPQPTASQPVGAFSRRAAEPTSSPAAGLRVANILQNGEHAAPPAFTEAQAPGSQPSDEHFFLEPSEPQPLPQQAARPNKLFDRMKELAFPRSTGGIGQRNRHDAELEFVEQGRQAPQSDDQGDVPAFLRRERALSQ